jgi:RNA polymerase sigma-70 factor (ECF subfamily)
MPVVDEGTLYDHLEYTELEQWMNEQIDRLPTTSRIVLTMRQLEHRELSEIAGILGIRQTSVSTLLSRARHELMEKLKRRSL